jgi:outer membrane protein assembly factor BamD
MPPAHSVWVWTRKTKKWVNPKTEAGSHPESQFKLAESLEQKESYGDAISAYRKLIKKFPNNSLAPKAQYRIGIILEKIGRFFKAAEAYQKVIDKYPASDQIKNAIEAQEKIADTLFEKEPGFFKKGDLARAIKVYNMILKNSRFSKEAAKRQYRIAVYYFLLKDYKRAILEYQKVTDNYPNSDKAEISAYQIGICCFQQSLAIDYDQFVTDKAIAKFEDFINLYPKSQYLPDVKKKLYLLKEKSAEKIYLTAKFYRKQKKYTSAKIYFEEVIRKYPESKWAELAKLQIK